MGNSQGFDRLYQNNRLVQHSPTQSQQHIATTTVHDHVTRAGNQ